MVEDGEFDIVVATGAAVAAVMLYFVRKKRHRTGSICGLSPNMSSPQGRDQRQMRDRSRGGYYEVPMSAVGSNYA